MADRATMVEVTEPYAGASIASVPITDDAGVDSALAAADAAHRRKGGKPDLAERLKILHRIGAIMRERRDDLAVQAAREGGKPLVDSQVEVDRAIDGIDVCVEVLRSEQGNVIPMRLNAGSAGRLAVTQRVPIGPVVAVSAFNHPLNLVVHQVTPAIATGCPVIVKPAMATPLSCRAFVDIVHEAGLPPDLCQVVHTRGETSTRLVTDPRVAFFGFIGSPGVGWMLRSKLAPGTRCALEHGGAAPVIVAADADLDVAVPSILKGGFYHAGQVCVSVQRVFAHADVFDRLAEALTEGANKLVVGDPTSAATEVGPLIEHKEADRVAAWVDEAVSSGATMTTGGERLSASTYAPTVLLDPPADAKISRQEVFGPVVALYRFTELDEAIERANAIDFHFQSAVFTQDIDTAMKAYAGLDASAVMVNDHTAFRVDWMPFAGLGPSGHGVGGMPYTMHEMSVERLLVIKSAGLAGL